MIRLMTVHVDMHLW
jgi:hypothetical protein